MMLLRRLHRWLGLALAVPMLVMGVTGFILAITPVFDDLTQPRPSQASGNVHDLASIVAVARATAPSGAIPVRIRLDDDPRASVDVEMAQPPLRRPIARLRIDPITLAVVRVEQPSKFYSFVHGLHEMLLIEGPYGKPVVGWFGVGLLLLGVLGIPLWWPASGHRAAALRINCKARGYRLQRSLHGVTGIWLVAMLVLQSAGGVALAFPGALITLLGIGEISQPAARGETLNITAVVEAATAEVPQAALRDIRLPSLPGRPLTLAFLADSRFDGAPAVIVTMSPSGRVLSVRDPDRGSFGAWVFLWLRALHEAGGLGPLWRVAVCLTGLALPLLSVTGAGMWLIRAQRRRAMAQQQDTVLQGSMQ